MGDRSSQSSRDGGEVRLLGRCDAGSPCLEAIDISRWDRSLRMAATWFAAVYDVDADNNPFRRLIVAVAKVPILELADTRPDKRISRCWTRFRSADAVIVRIAEDEVICVAEEVTVRLIDLSCSVCAAWQTGTRQSVELPLRSRRVEGCDDILRFLRAILRQLLEVAVVFPLTTDARIAKNFTAILMAVWSA